MFTVRAHYDGSHVHLDEPLPLKKNDQLIVTLVQQGEQKRPQFSSLLPGLSGAEIKKLVGIISLGGDAVEDTENLYR